MANKRKASSDSDSGVSPTAYNLFLKNSWDNDNKKENYSKFAEECSQKWAGMADEQKKVFIEEAASLKGKLDEEKEKKKMANKRKASSDSDSGVSPTAYNLFLKNSWDNDNKKENYSKFAEECSQKWAGMADEQKKVFIEEAASLKGKLDEEKEKKKKVKDGAKKTKKDGGSEKKRPLGPYIIFCNDVRVKVKEEHPDWVMIDVAKELGRRWNALSASEKGKYQAKATEGKEKYLKEKAEAKVPEDGKAKTSKRVDEKQDDSH